MGSFVTRDSRFVYMDGDNEKVILDLNDFMKNKSRLPFHTLTGDLTVGDLIVDLMDAHESVSEGTDQGRFMVEYTFLDVLILEYAVQTSKPLKAVELGAGNGVLSYHIGSILGVLNKRAELNCVSDIIGNGYENTWIDAICKISEDRHPMIRFLVSDYEKTMLCDKAFDFVIINGTVDIENIRGTIEEAIRLISENGRIYCICNKDNWFLYDSFKYLINNYEEYFVGKSGYILEGRFFSKDGIMSRE
ncbi:MAG: class I SAM-dependent methyltransferase [Lachnospiraceae bacterium]|nr:class I SAM-dependent methyltransferase [Lachnospiraceae bacterium]